MVDVIKKQTSFVFMFSDKQSRQSNIDENIGWHRPVILIQVKNILKWKRLNVNVKIQVY